MSTITVCKVCKQQTEHCGKPVACIACGEPVAEIEHCEDCDPSFIDCWNGQGPCRKKPLPTLSKPPGHYPDGIYGEAQPAESQAAAQGQIAELENKLLLQAQEIEILKRDSARLDWLEAHPLPGQVHGGSEDGIQAKFWAISCHPQWTIRDAIDAVAQTKEGA